MEVSGQQMWMSGVGDESAALVGNADWRIQAVDAIAHDFHQSLVSKKKRLHALALPFMDGRYNIDACRRGAKRLCSSGDVEFIPIRNFGLGLAPPAPLGVHES